MKAIAMENAAAELENRRSSDLEAADEEKSESQNDTSSSDQAFTEGLSRILSGINANMSKAVCSSPLAHLIVSNDGPRSEFSHEFTHLLVTKQLMFCVARRANSVLEPTTQKV